MKEKILSGLQKAIEASNEKITLDARTISDYAANISVLVTDESQLTEQFYAAHLGIIKSVNGNVNHVIAAQVEEAKKNLPNPQTPPAAPSLNPPMEEKPQWAKDLDARFSAIEQANLASQKQAQRTQLLESVKKTALTKDADNEKSGWATNAGALSTALRIIHIDDTDTEETIMQKIKTEYNTVCLDMFGKSDAVPGVGNGGGSETADWSEEKRRLQERGSLPKD